jgi:hypothetical protein
VIYSIRNIKDYDYISKPLGKISNVLGSTTEMLKHLFLLEFLGTVNPDSVLRANSFVTKGIN